MAQADIVFSAPLSATTEAIAIGRVLILDTTQPQEVYVPATAATVATLAARPDGVAFTQGDASNRSVVLLVDGILAAEQSGLGTGSRSWLRVSSTGWLERVTSPSSFDVVVGWAESDGRAKLNFAIPYELIINGVPSGGTVPSGDGFRHISGSVEDGTARAVNVASSDITGTLTVAHGGTGLTTLGSELQILRTNAGATAMEWWALSVNLATQVTGTLPVANGGTGLTAWPGADTQVLFRDGSGINATAGLVFDKSTGVVTVSSACAVGTSASAGNVRLPKAALVMALDDAGSADLCVFEAGNDGLDYLQFGSRADGTSNRYGELGFTANDNITFNIGNAVGGFELTAEPSYSAWVCLNLTNFAIEGGASPSTLDDMFQAGIGVFFQGEVSAVPTTSSTLGAIDYVQSGIKKSLDRNRTVHRMGSGDGQADIDMTAGNATLTADQQSCVTQYCHGGGARTLFYNAPAGDDSVLMRFVRNENAGDLTVSTTAGGSASFPLTAGTGCWALVLTTGAYKATAAVSI